MDSSSWSFPMQQISINRCLGLTFLNGNCASLGWKQKYCIQVRNQNMLMSCVPIRCKLSTHLGPKLFSPSENCSLRFPWNRVLRVTSPLVSPKMVIDYGTKCFSLFKACDGPRTQIRYHKRFTGIWGDHIIQRASRGLLQLQHLGWDFSCTNTIYCIPQAFIFLYLLM